MQDLKIFPAVISCLLLFISCSPRPNIKTETKPVATAAAKPVDTAALCRRATAIARLEILGAEIIETTGDEKPSHAVYHVSGKVVQNLKGDLKEGELLEYYNALEADLQYPPPGHLIVFLIQTIDAQTQKQAWAAMKDSEFIYTEKLLQEIKACVAKN